jgi:hypothetical protein
VAGKAGKPVPAFLGYIVPQETTLMADKLMQQSWLPVVLDLDETLLVANSAHQLLTQIHKATISRSDSCLMHPHLFKVESMLLHKTILLPCWLALGAHMCLLGFLVHEPSALVYRTVMGQS